MRALLNAAREPVSATLGSNRRGPLFRSPVDAKISPGVCGVFFGLGVLALGGQGIAFGQSGFMASPTAKNAQAYGRVFVSQRVYDLDGDGTSEVCVIQRHGNEFVLRIYRPMGAGDDAEGFRVVAESEVLVATRVLRFELRRMLGRRLPQIVAALEQKTPAQTTLHLVVMGATEEGIRRIFQKSFLVPDGHKKSLSSVDFGDLSGVYDLRDVNGDGLEEIVWSRAWEHLSVDGPRGRVRFGVGARQTVFAYDRERERYALQSENARADFLPPRPAFEVRASVQVPKIWGTAQPFWATDGDLGTSWNVPSSRALGATLKVRFRAREKISMVRVVPGCGASKEAWTEHHRLRGFTLTLGSGLRVRVDRRRLFACSPGVLAQGSFPLNGDFGAQVLVFFREPQEMSWARLEVTGVERGVGSVSEVCLSELSFHSSVSP